MYTQIMKSKYIVGIWRKYLFLIVIIVILKISVVLLDYYSVGNFFGNTYVLWFILMWPFLNLAAFAIVKNKNKNITTPGVMNVFPILPFVQYIGFGGFVSVFDFVSIALAVVLLLKNRHKNTD